MRKQKGPEKARIAYILILFACTLAIISLLMVQTSLSQGATASGMASPIRKDSLTAVPLVWLLLPAAAVGAYALERHASKTETAPSNG